MVGPSLAPAANAAVKIARTRNATRPSKEMIPRNFQAGKLMAIFRRGPRAFGFARRRWLASFPWPQRYGRAPGINARGKARRPARRRHPQAQESWTTQAGNRPFAA